MDEAANPGAIPAAVLDAMARGTPATTPSTDWRIEPLAPGRPVFRVTTDSGSFIVKHSDQPGRVVVVSRLFTRCSIACADAILLVDDWLVLNDLRLPTIDETIAHGVTCEKLLTWMPGLGAAAAQADFVAMRDRNLRNLLVAEGPSFVHIDLEAAFSAGLFDRVMRPARFARYLLRRMFFDVIDAASAGAESIDAMFKLFAEGFAQGQQHINRTALDASASLPLSWKQRLYLRTRLPDTPKTQRLLTIAFDDERERWRARTEK